MATWHFAGAEGLTPRGPNNGDIEQFRGAPIRSLAREICQNSLDALLPAEKEKWARGEKGLPVVVEFSVFKGIFPEKETLFSKVEKMRAYWKTRQKNDFAVVELLTNVMGNLQNTLIPYLRISDRNTTGLCGIGKDGSPWDNLVMTVGASDKPSTAGGSKGVGHAAPFACSSTQTVFYFTNNIEKETAFAGVVRLVAWKEGDMGYEEIGYFGNGKFGKEPLTEKLALGDTYERTETGSDVYISGFDQDGWEDGIIQSALDSFLLAIYDGKLEIRVGNTTINSCNLASIFAERMTSGHQFINHADQYYKVLTSPESKKFVKEITQEGMRGKLVLKMLVDPSLTAKRVALVRDTGMLIFERDHISSNIKFAGVLEVEGEELNAFLRRLENGQHTEWSEKRAPAGDEGKAKNLLKSFGQFCRESLRAMTELKPGEKIDSGLGSTFSAGDNSEDPSSEDEEDITDELKPIAGHKKMREASEKGGKKKKRKIKVKKEESEDDESDVSDGDGGGDAGGEPLPPGPTPPGPPGPPPLPPTPLPLPLPKVTPIKWIDIEMQEIDCLCVNKAQSEYLVVFTPSLSSRHGKLKLFVMAETEAYNATIKSAKLENGDELLVSDENAIEGLSFVKGQSMAILVTLDYTDYCSLEVEAYGYN